MTTKLEQAARQALEALEQNTYYNFDDDIKALREALAEREQRTEEQAEQDPTNLCQNSTELVEKDCGGAHHHCYAGSFGG